MKTISKFVLMTVLFVGGMTVANAQATATIMATVGGMAVDTSSGELTLTGGQTATLTATPRPGLTAPVGDILYIWADLQSGTDGSGISLSGDFSSSALIGFGLVGSGSLDNPVRTVTAPTVTQRSTVGVLVQVGVFGAGPDGSVRPENTANLLLVIVPPPSNPTVSAGDDQTVMESEYQVAGVGGISLVGGGVDVMLTGTASDVQDAIAALTLAWTQTAPTTGLGSGIMLTTPATLTPTFTAPNVLSNTTLTFQLLVTDSDSNTNMDTVNVVVTGNDDPPLVYAGAALTVMETEYDADGVFGTTATALSGAAALDPEGASLSYKWTVVKGANFFAAELTPDIIEDTSLAASFVPPNVFQPGRVLDFTLTATQASVTPVTAMRAITVNGDGDNFVLRVTVNDVTLRMSDAASRTVPVGQEVILVIRPISPQRGPDSTDIEASVAWDDSNPVDFPNLLVAVGGSTRSQTVMFTPASAGMLTFTYVLSDDESNYPPASFTLIVETPAAPVIVPMVEVRGATLGADMIYTVESGVSVTIDLEGTTNAMDATDLEYIWGQPGSGAQVASALLPTGDTMNFGTPGLGGQVTLLAASVTERTLARTVSLAISVGFGAGVPRETREFAFVVVPVAATTPIIMATVGGTVRDVTDGTVTLMTGEVMVFSAAPASGRFTSGTVEYDWVDLRNEGTGAGVSLTGDFAKATNAGGVAPIFSATTLTSRSFTAPTVSERSTVGAVVGVGLNSNLPSDADSVNNAANQAVLLIVVLPPPTAPTITATIGGVNAIGGDGNVTMMGGQQLDLVAVPQAGLTGTVIADWRALFSSLDGAGATGEFLVTPLTYVENAFDNGLTHTIIPPTVAVRSSVLVDVGVGTSFGDGADGTNNLANLARVRVFVLPPPTATIMATVGGMAVDTSNGELTLTGGQMATLTAIPRPGLTAPVGDIKYIWADLQNDRDGSGISLSGDFSSSAGIGFGLSEGISTSDPVRTITAPTVTQRSTVGALVQVGLFVTGPNGVTNAENIANLLLVILPPATDPIITATVGGTVRDVTDGTVTLMTGDVMVLLAAPASGRFTSGTIRYLWDNLRNELTGANPAGIISGNFVGGIGSVRPEYTALAGVTRTFTAPTVSERSTVGARVGVGINNNGINDADSVNNAANKAVLTIVVLPPAVIVPMVEVRGATLGADMIYTVESGVSVTIDLGGTTNAMDSTDLVYLWSQPDDGSNDLPLGGDTRSFGDPNLAELVTLVAASVTTRTVAKSVEVALSVGFGQGAPRETLAFAFVVIPAMLNTVAWGGLFRSNFQSGVVPSGGRVQFSYTSFPTSWTGLPDAENARLVAGMTFAVTSPSSLASHNLMGVNDGFFRATMPIVQRATDVQVQWLTPEVMRGGNPAGMRFGATIRFTVLPSSTEQVIFRPNGSSNTIGATVTSGAEVGVTLELSAGQIPADLLAALDADQTNAIVNALFRNTMTVSYTTNFNSTPVTISGMHNIGVGEFQFTMPTVTRATSLMLTLMTPLAAAPASIAGKRYVAIMRYVVEPPFGHVGTLRGAIVDSFPAPTSGRIRVYEDELITLSVRNGHRITIEDNDGQVADFRSFSNRATFRITASGSNEFTFSLNNNGGDVFGRVSFTLLAGMRPPPSVMLNPLVPSLDVMSGEMVTVNLGANPPAELTALGNGDVALFRGITAAVTAPSSLASSNLMLEYVARSKRHTLVIPLVAADTAMTVTFTSMETGGNVFVGSLVFNVEVPDTTLRAVARDGGLVVPMGSAASFALVNLPPALQALGESAVDRLLGGATVAVTSPAGLTSADLMVRYDAAERTYTFTAPAVTATTQMVVTITTAASNGLVFAGRIVYVVLPAMMEPIIFRVTDSISDPSAMDTGSSGANVSVTLSGGDDLPASLVPILSAERNTLFGTGMTVTYTTDSSTTPVSIAVTYNQNFNENRFSLPTVTEPTNIVITFTTPAASNGIRYVGTLRYLVVPTQDTGQFAMEIFTGNVRNTNADRFTVRTGEVVRVGSRRAGFTTSRTYSVTAPTTSPYSDITFTDRGCDPSCNFSIAEFTVPDELPAGGMMTVQVAGGGFTGMVVLTVVESARFSPSIVSTPTRDAMADDVTVLTGGTVTLDATASDKVGGSGALQYEWTVGNPAMITVTSATSRGASLVFDVGEVVDPMTVRVTLRLRDGDEGATLDTVTAIRILPNFTYTFVTNPVTPAGEILTVAPGDTVTLTATGFVNNSGISGNRSSSWGINLPVTTYQLRNPNTAAVTIAFREVAERTVVPLEFVTSVSATSGPNPRPSARTRKNLIIVVEPAAVQAIIVPLSADRITLGGMLTVQGGTPVTLSGRASSTTIDGASLEYAWTNVGSLADGFTFGAANTASYVINSPADLLDAITNQQYQLIVTAVDGTTRTASEPVMLDVVFVPNMIVPMFAVRTVLPSPAGAPLVAGADGLYTVLPDTTLTVSAIGTTNGLEDQPNRALTYDWTRSGKITILGAGNTPNVALDRTAGIVTLASSAVVETVDDTTLALSIGAGTASPRIATFTAFVFRAVPLIFADLVVTPAASIADDIVTVRAGEIVTLDAADATVYSGDAGADVTYAWSGFTAGTSADFVRTDDGSVDSLLAVVHAEVDMPTDVTVTLALSAAGGVGPVNIETPIRVLPALATVIAVSPRPPLVGNLTVSTGETVTLTADASGNVLESSASLTYSWTRESGPAVTVGTNAIPHQYAFTAPIVTMVSQVVLQLRTTYVETVMVGSVARMITHQSEETVTITVIPIRPYVLVLETTPAPPNVGENVTVVTGNSVTLDASNTVKNIGTADLTYRWTTDSNLVRISGAITTDESVTLVTDTVNVATDVEVTLRLQDGADVSTAEDFVITINILPNFTLTVTSTPTTPAGQTLTVSPGDVITLAVAAVNNLTGVTGRTFVWSPVDIDRPRQVLASGTSTANLTLSFGEIVTPRDLVIRLEAVGRSGGNTVRTDVEYTLRIVPAQVQAVITPVSQGRMINGILTVQSGTAVTLSGRASSSTLPNVTLDYLWTPVAPAPANTFALSGADTAAFVVTSPAVLAAATTHVFQLVVTATAGGLTAVSEPETVTIMFTMPMITPMISVTGATAGDDGVYTVAAGMTVTLSTAGSVSIPPGADMQYFWSEDGTDRNSVIMPVQGSSPGDIDKPTYMIAVADVVAEPTHVTMSGTIQLADNSSSVVVLFTFRILPAFTADIAQTPAPIGAANLTVRAGTFVTLSAENVRVNAGTDRGRDVTYTWSGFGGISAPLIRTGGGGSADNLTVVHNGVLQPTNVTVVLTIAGLGTPDLGSSVINTVIRILPAIDTKIAVFAPPLPATGNLEVGALTKVTLRTDVSDNILRNVSLSYAWTVASTAPELVRDETVPDQYVFTVPALIDDTDVVITLTTTHLEPVTVGATTLNLTHTSVDTITITILAQEVAAIITAMPAAGDDGKVTMDGGGTDRVTLHSRASIPPNLTNAAITWTQTSTIELPSLMENAAGNQIDFLLPAFAQSRELIYRLSVTDSGLTVSDDVTIVIRPTLPTAVIVVVSPTLPANNILTVLDGVRISLNGEGSSDLNGDTITYSWGQTSGTAVSNQFGFTLNAIGFTAPEVSADEDIVMELRVNNGTADSDTTRVTISVTAEEDAPLDTEVAATADGAAVMTDGSAMIDEETVVTLKLTSTDPEGLDLSYAWVQTNPGSGVLGGDLLTAEEAVASDVTLTLPNLEADGNVVFEITATDPATETETITITLAVGADADVPIAVATANAPGMTAPATGNLTVADGEPVELKGAMSSDPEEANLTYVWRLISPTSGAGSETMIDDVTLADTTFTAPELPDLMNMDLVFGLIVNDGAANVGRTGNPQDSVEATVTVHVIAENDPPMITITAEEAGASPGDMPTPLTDPFSIDEEMTAAVSITATIVDPDSAPTDFTYAWTQTAPTVSPHNTLVAGQTMGTANLMFPMPVIRQVVTDTNLVFDILVTDDTGVTDMETVTIVINGDDDPTTTVIADSPTITVAEEDTGNRIAVQALDATMSNDPEDLLTLTWEQLPFVPPANPASVPLTVLAQMLAANVLPDDQINLAEPELRIPNLPEDTLITLMLTSTDGSDISANTTTAMVTINVTANDDQVRVDAGTPLTIPEGEIFAVTTATAVDYEEQELTYIWRLQGDPSPPLPGNNAIELVDPGTLTVSFTAPQVSEVTTVTLRLETIAAGSAVGVATAPEGTQTGVATVTDDLVLMIAGSDTLPAVTFGVALPSVEEDATLTIAEVSAVDPEGAALGYEWTVADATPDFTEAGKAVRGITLRNAANAIAGLNGGLFIAPQVSVNTTVTLRLAVTDTTSQPPTVTQHLYEVQVTGTNDEPVMLSVDGPPTPQDGTTITLTGAASDPEGTAIAYSWTQVTPATSVHDLISGADNEANVTLALPELLTNTPISFRMTATDATGRSANTVFNANIQAFNSPPVVAAVASRVVMENETVTLALPTPAMGDPAAATDPDGDDDALTYLWSQTLPLSSQPGGGQVLTAADTPAASFTVPDLENGTQLVFRLRVTDVQNGTTDVLVTLTVSADDDPPIATIRGASVLTAAENARVTLDARDSMDPEQLPLVYVWTLTDPGPTTGVDANKGMIEIMDADTAQPIVITPSQLVGNITLIFTVTVADPALVVSEAATVTLTVNAGTNDSPMAVSNALPQATVSEGVTVTLNGTMSTDPEGEALTYRWRVEEGGSGANIITNSDLVNANSAQATVTAPTDLATNVTLQFELTATDARGLETTSTLVVVTTPGNDDAPTANAGSNQTVGENVPVVLDGSQSADPENLDLGYAWTLAGATPAGVDADKAMAIVLTNANRHNPTFTSPQDLLAAVTVTFSLTVSDPGGNTDSDTVAIVISAGVNNVPSVRIATTLTAYDEDETVSLTGEATDPEGGNLNYLWVQTAPNGGSPLSDLTLSGGDTLTPEFIIPNVKEGDTLRFQLQVTEPGGVNMVAADINLFITADNDPLEALLSGPAVIGESAKVTLDARASNDPEGDAVSYAWTQTAGPPVELSATDEATVSFTTPDLLAPAEMQFQLVMTVADDTTTDPALLGATLTHDLAVDGNNDPPVVRTTVRVGDAEVTTVPAVVKERDVVTLDGSATADDDGQLALTYFWEQVSGVPSVQLNAPTAATTTFTMPELVTPATLVFRLTATDSGDDVGTGTVTVTANADDDAPIADAGDDQTQPSGSIVTLSGDNSRDLEGQPLTFAWAQTAPVAAAVGEPTVAGSNLLTNRITNSATLIFIIPHDLPDGTAVVPVGTELVFALTVTDQPSDGTSGIGKSHTETVTVTVGRNNAARNEVNAAILPEITRAVAAATVSAVTQRIDVAKGLGNTISGGGYSANFTDDGMAGMLRDYTNAVNGDRDLRTMLKDSNFVMPLNHDGDIGFSPAVAVWGNGEYRALSGDNNGMRYDGKIYGLHLGIDATRTRADDGSDAVFGVAFSKLQGDFEYSGQGGGNSEGDYQIDIASFHPYAGWKALGMDLWSAASFGRGSVKADTSDAQDIKMSTFGIGGAGEWWHGKNTTVRLKGEMARNQINLADVADNVATTRFRLGSEASQRRNLNNGAAIAPSVEVGVYSDLGDGDGGIGAELIGKLQYHHPQRRFTAEGKMRVLAEHTKGNQEWGVQVGMRLRPGADGQGVSFNLTPGYGNHTAEITNLWNHKLPTDLAADADYQPSLNANLSYGIPMSMGGILTPNTELTLSETNTYRVGINWNRQQATLKLTTEHNQSNNENAVLLKGEFGF